MWGGIKSTILHSRLRFFFWLPTAIVVGNWYEVHIITGKSMQPTLNPNSSFWRDVALFKRDVGPNAKYQRDEIVALKSPENPKTLLVKRILAKEGDTVKTLPPYPDREVVIPQNNVWVEGDEHFWSGDSNRFGPVSECLIQSKLVMILWPLDRFGPIRNSLPPTSEARRVITNDDKGFTPEK